MNLALNLKPQVKGVAIVTRRGVVVGTVPAAIPLPAKVAKRVEEQRAEEGESDSAQSAQDLDPF